MLTDRSSRLLSGALGLWLGCFAIAMADTQPACEFRKNLIVGSGPGSLQMAHYLQSASREYLILEASDGVSSFFRQYPRWRQLISLNKRHTGKNSLDHNMRHDWNSLLSDPSPANPDAKNSYSEFNVTDVPKQLLFRSYSKLLWPEADALVKYMETFASEMNLKVRFNSRVSKISKEGGRFFLQTPDKLFCSERLFVGTGLQKPTVLPTDLEIDARWPGNIETYGNHSTNREDYESQRVLIIGRGNAAFEVAQNIMHATQYVHMVARRGRIKLAWETHYPGGVRTIHNSILETYMLKSMDLLWEEDFSKVKLSYKNGLWYVDEVPDPDEEDFEHKVENPDTSEPSEEGYHRVISCVGWTFDRSIFDGTAMPKSTQHKNYEGKFPLLNHRFESVSIPDLFFVGTPMHGHDYKQAAGGFIHGFRYLVRGLHRILEQDEEAHTPWPAIVFQNLRKAQRRIHERLNTMSGPYQMFGHLADVIVVSHRLNLTKSVSKWVYREEVPVKYLQNVGAAKWCQEETELGAQACGVIQLTLEYGKGAEPGKRDPFSEDRVGFTGDTSHFLHPVFRSYEKGALVGKPQKAQWYMAENKTQLSEQPLTDWDRPDYHEQVSKLLKRVARRQVGWLRSGNLKEREDL